MDKRANNIEAAVEGIEDGAVVLIGGFGNAGEPIELLNALAERNLKDLTLVANGAGASEDGMGRLLASGGVRKAMCFLSARAGLGRIRAGCTNRASLN